MRFLCGIIRPRPHGETSESEKSEKKRKSFECEHVRKLATLAIPAKMDRSLTERMICKNRPPRADAFGVVSSRSVPRARRLKAAAPWQGRGTGLSPIAIPVGFWGPAFQVEHDDKPER